MIDVPVTAEIRALVTAAMAAGGAESPFGAGDVAPGNPIGAGVLLARYCDAGTVIDGYTIIRCPGAKVRYFLRGVNDHE